MSRRTSRPDQRGGRADAGRRADSDYDDYDYAPDGYQQDDDNWSPDEYFSPEGIKGKWAAGAAPGERPAGRGARDAGRDYDDYGSGPQRARGPAGGYGRDSRQHDSYQRDSYPQGGSHGPDEYGTGEFGTGAYDLPEGADDTRGERTGGRRRRDRGDRGDWRSRLGRRDRDDDIWPDDGVSDEDYWASVAADRPFTSTGADATQVVDSRPPGRPAGPARPAGDPRLTGDPRPAGDPRLTGDRLLAGESRTGSGGGRLGPPPGQPGQGQLAQVQPGQGQPGQGQPGQGQPGQGQPGQGQLARPGAGPTPARSAAGPNGMRSTTGPNAMRPPAGPNAGRPAAGPAQPGLSQPGLSQPGLSQPSPAQPSFQPNGGRGASRPPTGSEWDRTERIDRIPAAGYSDPRMSGRNQPPAPARARGDSADRRMPDRTGGGRPGADDDPLTSKAFSRSALTDTDGRSYRAARRSQVPGDRYDAALSEQTQAFSMPGQYPADAQAPTGRYPAGGGGQPTGRNPYDRGTAPSYPYPSQPYPSRPAPDQDEARYRPARPNGYESGYNGADGGSYNSSGDGGYGDSRGGRY